MADRPGLISVRTDVVRTVLVDGIADEVLQRLQRGDGPQLAGTEEPRIARAGWLARVVERERFGPARAPCAWLREELRERSPDDPEAAIDATCAALAASEPLDRPSPQDPAAATWRVPGPGGHVRHEIARRAIADLGPPDPPATLKRAWTHGFLRRCCEEELPHLFAV